MARRKGQGSGFPCKRGCGHKVFGGKHEHEEGQCPKSKLGLAPGLMVLMVRSSRNMAPKGPDWGQPSKMLFEDRLLDPTLPRK